MKGLVIQSSASPNAEKALVNPPDLFFFCSTWGAVSTFEEFCKKAVDAGFDGIETDVPADEKEVGARMEALHKYGLSYIFQYGASETTFDTHLSSYEQGLARVAALHPLLINCHTGRDYFNDEQNEALITSAAAIGNAAAVPIVHETHRGRFSFAAHITRKYLSRLPVLSLALDISHWCNVHESMLDDQQEAVSLALSRTGHIHARIGHPQGPQVNDPRAPEWQPIVQQHLAWWDIIVADYHAQKKTLTITTEFGPADYLPTLPYTRQPLADQWELNCHMLHLLKARYHNFK